MYLPHDILPLVTGYDLILVIAKLAQVQALKRNGHQNDTFINKLIQPFWCWNRHILEQKEYIMAADASSSVTMILDIYCVGLCFSWGISSFPFQFEYMKEHKSIFYFFFRTIHHWGWASLVDSYIVSSWHVNIEFLLTKMVFSYLGDFWWHKLMKQAFRLQLSHTKYRMSYFYVWCKIVSVSLNDCAISVIINSQKGSFIVFTNI